MSRKCRKNIRERERRATSPTGILIRLTSVAIVIAVLLEPGSVIRMPWGLSPRFYLLYGLGWSLVMLPCVLMRYTHRKGLIYATFVMILAALWMVPWSPRKQFLKRLYGIRRGMTVAEADARMKGYMRHPNWWGNCTVYRHSQIELGGDLGVVRFEDGNVVGVKFEPD